MAKKKLGKYEIISVLGKGGIGPLGITGQYPRRLTVVKPVGVSGGVPE